jgi:uncharacterized membrane protein YfcA
LKEEEKKRQAAIAKAKKAAAEAEKKKKQAEKKRQQEEKKLKELEKKQKQKEALKKKEGEEDGEDGEFYFDEELNRKVRRINDRSMTKDVCCGQKGFRVCMGMGLVFMFFVFPVVYAALMGNEYKQYGWDRFLARGDGHGYWEDGIEPQPTIEPSDKGDAVQHPPRLKHIFKDNEAPLLWLLPLIGFFVGLFGNMMPLSAGLIIMPLFQELSVCRSSEATLALTCAITFVSNGLFGFFSWCIRDGRFFIWRAVFLCTPCAWMGYFLGVTNHLTLSDMILSDANNTARNVGLLHTYIRMFLGCLMFALGLVAMFGACMKGVNRCCCPSKSGGTTPGGKSFCQWIIVLLCSFNTGYFFVANVGAGMGFTTFFVLSLFLGVETKRALPTSIVIAGWTAAAPALMNAIELEAFPMVRLLMVCPGLWFGAVLAPWFSKCGGPMGDLVVYSILLIAIGTAVVVLAGKAMQINQEDMNIDIQPMFTLPAVEQAYAEGNDGGGGDDGGAKEGAARYLRHLF